MKFFALSAKEGEWSDPTHPLYIPLTDTLQWVMSAHAISRPQLLDVLNSSVGTEQLIYLYAKVLNQFTVFCPHWSAVVNTDHHSALPDHHSFYQYMNRSSLSSYAWVVIVYLHVRSYIFLASHGPWLIVCTEQEHIAACNDRMESECALYRTIKFVGGESSRRAHACAHAYCALYGDVQFRVFCLLLEPRLVNHHSMSPGQNTEFITHDK